MSRRWVYQPFAAVAFGAVVLGGLLQAGCMASSPERSVMATGAHAPAPPNASFEQSGANAEEPSLRGGLESESTADSWGGQRGAVFGAPAPAPLPGGGSKPGVTKNEPGKPADPAKPPEPGAGPEGKKTEPASTASASDTVKKAPMLIYEASIALAVYRVEDTLSEIEKLAGEMGGYLASRSSEQIVIRVPKDKFFDALKAIDKVGDVLRRSINSQDVTDEFLDLELRLKNARVMRDRLQELLAKANNVTDSLAIEKELQRITEQIERMEGRLKLLRDKLAFSKITVSVGAKRTETIGKNPVKLPFSWMGSLGLSHLLQLRE